MAFIYKRNKYYWVSYYEGNRRVRKSLKVTSKAAALRLLAEYQIIEAKYKHDSRLLSINKTIAELFDEYIRQLHRERTKGYYEWAKRQLLMFCEDRGVKYANDIDIAIVEGIYNKRRQRSAGGARCLLRALKAVFNYAVKRGYMKQNPAREIKTDKPVRKIFRALTFDEIEKILRKAKERYPWLYPLYATAYYAGLRANELRYLEPRDVNFEEGYIMVRSKPENPIKDHQERIIPLNSKLRDILLAHKPGKNWLFETQSGRPRINNLNRELKLIARAVGITPEGINLQVLRETFGSHLRKKGVDIALISEYMGHSSIDVTLRHYAHVKIEQTHREIDRL